MTLLPKQLLNNFLLRLATGFGVGQLPSAPGTWGTLLALPLGVALMPMIWLHMLVCAIGFGVAVASAQSYLQIQSTESQDPSEVVVDEMLGILIALVWLPMNWIAISLSFVIFRLLDILKPFPISWFDKNGKGGLGIVADDVVAGILTNVIVQYIMTQEWW